MRKIGMCLGVALAVAAPALAQEQGPWAVDAMVAPNAGLGIAYQFSDRLSIRPWLGLGYADQAGVFVNVGAELRFDLLVGPRWAPYLSASAGYMHNQAVPVGVAGPYPGYTVQPNAGQFAAGAGLRYQVARRVSLFTEGRWMYTTYPSNYNTGGWGNFTVNGQNHVQLVLGATYIL